jgi:uncharacterized Fe-S cluster-containing radical SAM superfamily protein
MPGYTRYLTPTTARFSALELAKATEEIVCRADARKYTDFYAVGVYRGIATGYTVGCCLRCYYCWVDWSRDFPEKYGKLYTPREVCERLEKVARGARVRKARISGGEPTLCKRHLLVVLEHVEKSEDIELFILETNGILLGADSEYAHKLAAFEKVHIRVSLKAGNAEGFSERTGARGEEFELPFACIENLLAAGASFHVAAMTDPRVMPREERRELLARLSKIHPALAKSLEEEVVDPYETTLKRLRFACVELAAPRA